MIHTDVSIDGRSHLLTQSTDVPRLKRRLRTAARTRGSYVDFAVLGDRDVSVLVGEHTTVVFSAEDVEEESDQREPATPSDEQRFEFDL